MKIAVNCWVLRNKQLDGIGYFTVNAISRIIKAHPEVHFQILCDKNFSENYFDFGNVSRHPIFPALRHPVLYIIYMELILPAFLKKQKPDILLSTDGFLSLRSSCNQIAVIHDLNFEHYPGDLKIKNRLYYRFFFKKFAYKAKRIATVSEYSKRDIIDLYKIPPDRIDVVFNGINSSFHPLSKTEIEETRKKWSDGKPYFFFVGSMHPRKNIGRLMEAFALFKKKTKSDFKLLLAGSILWDEPQIKNAYHHTGYKDDIIFTGRLSDEDLKKVLGSAYALSFVPVFEGFGIPIIEAMQSAVPVICSNTTSMPEVAGEAAIFVNPLDPESICEGMEKLYIDQELRNRLIELGNKQKEKFSWDHTAALLWRTVSKTAEEIR